MLRLLSYLAPSIPAEFFELVAKVISEGTGIGVQLRFEQRISGPLAGDENPFRQGTADVGFVCSPSYKWLRQELDLLPVPVPADARANGRPVYFGDVVVHEQSPFVKFEDLRGRRWAYNDRSSRTGWFSMLERVAPLPPHEFFSEVVHAGSHLESLRLIRTGQVDTATIDSNALLNEARRDGGAAEVRIIESWGPFPIWPIVIRTGVPAYVKAAVHNALLNAHLGFGEQLRSYGFVRFADAERAAYEAQGRSA
jgi:ABC-type phosphate/phosphonate transport system substrate-binding protein